MIKYKNIELNGENGMENEYFKWCAVEKDCIKYEYDLATKTVNSLKTVDKTKLLAFGLISPNGYYHIDENVMIDLANTKFDINVILEDGTVVKKDINTLDNLIIFRTVADNSMLSNGTEYDVMSYNFGYKYNYDNDLHVKVILCITVDSITANISVTTTSKYKGQILLDLKDNKTTAQSIPFDLMNDRIDCEVKLL